MKYTISEDLAEYKGTVSNMHGFVHRYLDTGFKTKWTGFWAPPIKYLDYFAFKVNGEYLSPETVEKTGYGKKMVYHHRVGSLKVKEIVEAPEDLPGIRVSLKLINTNIDSKTVKVKMEAGVDIRHKSDDVPKAEYRVDYHNNSIVVESRGKNLRISSDNSPEIKEFKKIKEHFPGAKQVCVIPGSMEFEEEVSPKKDTSIKVEFTTSEPRYGFIEDKKNFLELKHSEGLLDACFDACEDSLKNLIYNRRGLGIIAGHPWFQRYWARDTFWSVLGLIDLGYFEEALKILENFSDQDDFPNEIDLDSGRGGFLGEDVPPLFIIAANELEKHHKLTDNIREKMDEAMEFLKIGDKGVVNHRPDGTWMDTLERNKAVDIQSLWLEASKIMDSPAKNVLKKGLDKFREDNVVSDNLEERGKVTTNSTIPLMFGHIDDNVFLDILNEHTITDYGAATLSKFDDFYNPEGYHTGSTWGLTSGWSACANFKLDKTGVGLNILEKMAEYIKKDQPGALPEVVNSETGENLGCEEQAWSAAMFVHAVDRYLFGLDVVDGELKANPAKGFTGTRKYKRVGDKYYSIRVRDGEAKVDRVV